METKKQMNTREKILANVATALDVAGSKQSRLDNVNARIGAHRRGPIPARGKKSGNELIEEFISAALFADAEIKRLKSINQIPAVR